ncbi:MAG: polysaccharide deacetylase family protein [Planctomycetota bacterium]
MAHDPTLRYTGYRPLRAPDGMPPSLLVVLDTEEEFDWSRDFDRANTGVESIQGVGPFQATCDERGVRPTYVVTYPIATQALSRDLLAQLQADGRAQVGAHQHPWVCPPYVEEVSAFHSYPGNLPADVERDKLEQLTAAIEGGFGVRPTIYKAGRYGFGPHTAAALGSQGYEIDLSACGPFDRSADGGPDDSKMAPTPFSFGAAGGAADGGGSPLVCFPTTGGFVGHLRGGLARAAFGLAKRPELAWSRLPGILARSGLVERILLSPEGYERDDLERLTRALLARGERVFTLSLHTPSLVPGYTSYVRSAQDLDAFLGRIRDYLDFFLGELGGRATTPDALRDELLAPPATPSQATP